jgi:hypothetical protein
MVDEDSDREEGEEGCVVEQRSFKPPARGGKVRSYLSRYSFADTVISSFQV